MPNRKAWKVDLRLSEVRAETHDAAADGLNDAVEHVLGVSNNRVPHEEGTLERSGRPFIDRDKLIGGVSYDTPYAVVQHEDMTLHHDPGRSAKYLESAMNGEREVAVALIAARIRRSLA